MDTHIPMPHERHQVSGEGCLCHCTVAICSTHSVLDQGTDVTRCTRWDTVLYQTRFLKTFEWAGTLNVIQDLLLNFDIQGRLALLYSILFEPPHGKNNNVHMRKQRPRSASQ